MRLHSFVRRYLDFQFDMAVHVIRFSCHVAFHSLSALRFDNYGSSVASYVTFYSGTEPSDIVCFVFY